MARSDPYRAFRFLVEIDNMQQGGFQSVAGLERETKTDTYREGGVNQSISWPGSRPIRR